MATCDFIPVGVGDSACAENYAGTGTTLYLFKSAWVDTTDLAIDDKNNMYTGFKLKEGTKLVPIELKPQSNKVDSEILGTGGKGFSNVGTVVVERDLDLAAVCARVMSNLPFGALLRKAGLNEGCFILWNPNVKPTFSLSDTTGDAFDSDNQATWTITSSPMPYPRMRISEEEFAALTIMESPTTE